MACPQGRANLHFIILAQKYPALQELYLEKAVKSAKKQE